MPGPLKPKSEPSKSQPAGATRRSALGLILGAPLLGACAGVQQGLSSFSNPFSSQAGPAGPAEQPLAVGNGQVKVGLILPLSAAGNAGVAAQSMKNAAEMALAEFQNPNIQLLIKDDGGNPQGAQQGTQQGLDEGAATFCARPAAAIRQARRRAPSRRSTKAPRSFWVRCLRRRCRRRRS